MEGFCYHCVDCEFTTGFERAAQIHSGDYFHGITRKFRGNCERHNGSYSQRIK